MYAIVRYAGHCTGYDEVVMEGDTKKFSFVAYYVKGDNIVSVATMGRDPVAVGIAEAMKLNLMPTAAEVKSGKANSDTILQRLKVRRQSSQTCRAAGGRPGPAQPRQPS